MKYPTNQILKVWDEALPRVAQNPEDPTDEDIAACAKLPGLTPADINAALRAGIKEEQRTIAAAKHVLQILATMLRENAGAPLPGLSRRRIAQALRGKRHARHDASCHRSSRT